MRSECLALAGRLGLTVQVVPTTARNSQRITRGHLAGNQPKHPRISCIMRLALRTGGQPQPAVVQEKASMPVMAWPMIRVWISLVPS
jgi:hypothetical protein